jgi:hypothetical protein
MDVSGLASAVSTPTSADSGGLSQAVSIAVLKKAIDVDADSATALIAAIPDMQASPNLPAHLGQNINTTA